MADTPNSRRMVEMAAITGAHSVSGEIRLKLFGEGVEALSRFKSFSIGEGTLTLKKIRSDNKGGAIARFAECQNRGDAEKLRGTVLRVAREELPALDDGEYYHADLIGLPVHSETGDRVGTVIAVQNFGATDILEIEKHPVPVKGMKTFMVPMTETAVTDWNSERMIIAEEFCE